MNLGDLEKFIHYQSLPELIKIAIIHYQFETIHPFLDGNGRIGRLLNTLYLVEKKILKQPILYLSDFFERNKTLYYDNLMMARNSNNIFQWIKFFLTGIIETSEKGMEVFEAILNLQKEINTKIQKLNSKQSNIQKIIEKLFKSPFINVKEIQNITNVSQRTSYNIIEILENMNILEEFTNAKRNKTYYFKRYINLFK